MFYEDLFKFYLSLEHRPLISLLVNRFTVIFVMLFGLGQLVH